MARLTVSQARGFWGELRPPTDKSLTHRAYMIGTLCRRGAVIRGPLRSEDCERTRAILLQLGVPIDGDEEVVIKARPHPPAPSPFFVPQNREGEPFPSRNREGTLELYCGNSGTTMRLMAGILAGAGISCMMTGDESLSRRPMRRVAEPLRLMGADISGETPPLSIRPASLRGISYETPVPSAQVKSAILLAGLFAEGVTTVAEAALSRDHTERMLVAAGCDVRRSGRGGGQHTVTVQPGLPDRLDMSVPGDISSAAFFMVAAALHGGPVTIRGVGTNPARTGILEVLRQAGSMVELIRLPEQQGEPVADIVVERGQLNAFRIEGALVPALIDEIPLLAVLATQCEGTSVIRDAAELRVKESDRIETMAEALNRMGARIDVHPDGMEIYGPTPLVGVRADARHDHRIAMSLAIAGTIAEGETVIKGAETIQTSFPGFGEELRRMVDG